MKLKHKSDRSLESLKVFPFVAWGITALFAVFVYNLATELQETAKRLEAQADMLEAKTKQPVENIDFTDV